jgi:DNA-binding NtrC family response regulator
LPGNIRQIENLVRWVLVNKDDDAPLNLSDLPLEIWQQLAEQGKRAEGLGASVGETHAEQKSVLGTPSQDLSIYIAKLLDLNDWNLSRSMKYCERLLIEAALSKTHGNQSQTARLLGITPRSIYNKVHKHQLRP